MCQFVVDFEKIFQNVDARIRAFYDCTHILSII